MKRVMLFALPILATMVVIGLGLFLVRSQHIEIRPRIDSLRHAVREAAEEFTEELAEERTE